jgi:hypothetical protein
MLDKAAPEFGRDPRSIEVVAAPVAAEPDVIKQYEDAGADGIVVFVMPAAEQEMLSNWNGSPRKSSADGDQFAGTAVS